MDAVLAGEGPSNLGPMIARSEEITVVRYKLRHGHKAACTECIYASAQAGQSNLEFMCLQ